jgi:hypothetical protein
MGASDIATDVVAMAIGIWGLVRPPRVWNGWFDRREVVMGGRRLTHSGVAASWWPFGSGGWRRAIRAYTAILCFWWAGCSQRSSSPWMVTFGELPGMLYGASS